MRGTVHAAIGASAPVGLVATQHVTASQGLVMATVAAGYSLLPDLDHSVSYASKALGGFIHRLVHTMCKAAFHGTATSRDERWATERKAQGRDPYHRSLTHTLAAAVALGVMAWLAAWTNAVAAGVVAALGAFLLWPLKRVTVWLALGAVVVAGVGSSLLLSPWLLALAVGGGYASSVVADACTKSGVPALWPIKIHGKRWWSIRLLGGLVTTGSSQEKGPAVGVALAMNALLLLLCP